MLRLRVLLPPEKTVELPAGQSVTTSVGQEEEVSLPIQNSRLLALMAPKWMGDALRRDMPEKVVGASRLVGAAKAGRTAAKVERMVEVFILKVVCLKEGLVVCKRNWSL